MEIRTFSRKQAGVIYSAVKRGDVNAPKAVISEMYGMVGSAYVGNTDTMRYVENFAAGIKNAIDAIFENDYTFASSILNGLAA